MIGQRKKPTAKSHDREFRFDDRNKHGEIMSIVLLTNSKYPTL